MATSRRDGGRGANPRWNRCMFVSRASTVGKTEAKTTRRVKATTASLCMAERISRKKENTLGNASGAWPSLIKNPMGTPGHASGRIGRTTFTEGAGHGPFHLLCQVEARLNSADHSAHIRIGSRSGPPDFSSDQDPHAARHGTLN